MTRAQLEHIVRAAGSITDESVRMCGRALSVRVWAIAALAGWWLAAYRMH